MDVAVLIKSDLSVFQPPDKFWRKIMLRKLLALTLPWFLAAFTAFALPVDQSKDVQEMQKQANNLDDEAHQMQGHEAIYQSLSKQLNIPVETLQAQQKSANFGFGQLFIANSLASATGKTFDQISQEFKSGQGWGEIAKANNVNLGKTISNLKRANNQIEMEKERTDRARANANSGANSGAASHANSQGMATGHGGQGGGPKGRR
jgi:hypothetical protein